MATRAGGIREEAGRRTAWAVIALTLMAVAFWSAQIGRRGWAPAAPGVPVAAFAAPRVPVATPAAPPDEIAAPASGTTGTIALPALPVAALTEPAVPAGTPGGIVAARPFAWGRTGRLDRARAMECLTAAVYYEAASEPDAGQAAVAQVVLNRVRHPAFPATVCGVVYQGSERAGCQFSFACDGAIARRVPSVAGWARAARSAAAALGGRVYAPVGLATHYHTYAVTPAWNRALVMTAAVGAHLFHRWKGWWGTPAAFHQIYAGGEPLPGPHPPAIAPTSPVLPTPAPLVAALPPLPPHITPLADIRPEWRSSGTAIAAPTPTAGDDHLPPAATVLPEWSDSGRILPRR